MISMRTWYATQLGMLGVEDTYADGDEERRTTKPLIVHLAESSPKRGDRRKHTRRPKLEDRVRPAE